MAKKEAEIRGIAGPGSRDDRSDTVSGTNSKVDGLDILDSSKYTGGPGCALYIDESTSRVNKTAHIGFSHEPRLLVLLWL